MFLLPLPVPVVNVVNIVNVNNNQQLSLSPISPLPPAPFEAGARSRPLDVSKTAVFEEPTMMGLSLV